MQAQRFQFSFHGAIVASQIDGDRIMGYNKLGYNLGIQGGLKFNDKSEFIVSQGFSSFGSSSGSVILSSINDYYIELSMKSANVLFAYAHYFGKKAKRSQKKVEANFRMYAGVRLH